MADYFAIIAIFAPLLTYAAAITLRYCHFG
jgi:hypothetical protein